MNPEKLQKQIGLLILFMLAGIALFGQKATTKNVKLSYTQLPLQPLAEDIKTYNTNLNMDITMENTDAEKLTRQYLKLEGYTKMEDQGDIIINAKFGEFKINKKRIEKEVYNVNQGKNVTGYYYEISFEYPVSLILTGKNGNIVFEQAIEHDEKCMHDDFGKWTYSIDELDTKFNTEKDELYTEAKNKCDKKALLKIKNMLESYFAYADVTKKIKIATGKGRKVDYNDLDKALQHVEKAFEIISSESGTEQAKSELNSAITIWENALKESSNNKKARINEEITTMLYYNIGIANWWLLNFEKAQECLDKALKNNLESSKPSSSDERLIKEVKDEIADYKKRLEVHGKI